MVKVKDDPIMAEPTQALPSYPSSSKRKSRPYAHHSHLPPQYSTHYHYCTYLPDGNEEIDLTDGATSPAKFYFGPGFEPQQPCSGGPRPTHNQGSQFVVFFHVNPGVTISFQMGDNLEILRGPVTVPMVSTNSSPPIAMPVQVPPGHMVQQIVDENGTLRHVILSPQHPPDIVSFTSHNSQTYGTCPGNSTNPSQHFFPGVSTTAYPTHFHSNMQPSHPMIPSPTHMRHSPPSNSTYYKDERTQRQHIKLKKKLNEKQRSDAVLTRRECANDLPKDQKESELNSVGTSENGEGSSVPEEDSYQLITDILSSVQPPVVSELTSRSALLQWAPPVRLLETLNNESQIEICESDLRYEVLLSDKSKEMKFKSIYSGTSLSCRIQDLKPGQDYSVCLQVHLDEFQGFATDPLKFSTPCCEPDQPQPPKLIHRSKNSLQLKWNSVNDNGSHVLYYVLEFDDGKCGDFIEFYRGRGKTHTLQKLQPATSYTFRLAVVNDVGKSLYSHSISYSTFDNPPTQPVSPTLIDADVHTLHLQWPRRSKDDEFILQMNDIETKYGFLNVYHGKDTYYVCRELNRFTDYVFRLRTKNEDGASPWSDEITYRTLPDRPTRPSKPVVKGRIHAHFFKIKWEPPNDTGGVPVTEYILEVNSGSGYETVYVGPETDAVCDKLTPGTTYQLRVSCVTQGGCSNYSDPCTVTTDAISPGLCSTPRVQGKVKANSAVIRWMKPDYNGGAPVLDYELEVVCTSSNQSVFYKSKETEFTINNLNPGSNYVVSVRAVNRIGPGNWSEPLKITSGAAPPSPPSIPAIVCRTPNHVCVEWIEPVCNGAPVLEYRLEMSPDKEIKFATVFQGLQLGYDVRNLAPAQTYYFRVQAFNSAGSSLYSPIASITTPAAPPSLVTTLKGESSTRSIKLYWNPPADNGSDITHYNIEIGDKTISTVEPVTEYLLDNLQPNTLYKIKIQAVNGVAPGSYSSSFRISTSKLPPSAPALECVGVGHNYLKLRWGEGRNLEYIQYCVEIENILTREFSCVYKGTALTCKVNKLQEMTSYKFRINATNDTGVGDFSSIFEFTTGVTPPGIIKNAKVMDVEHSSCTVEWAPAKNAFGDAVVYEVQLAKTKQLVFKQVHKSSETKCRIDNLEPSVEYSTRIVPYRITSTGELPGPSSAQINFTTLAVESEMTSKPTTSNYLQRNHSFHHSIWQLSLLKNLTGKYSSHIYVIAIMILGVIISLGIASFL